jgi:uncharacterized protein YukE
LNSYYWLVTKLRSYTDSLPMILQRFPYSCSTVQRRWRGGASKAKDEEDPKGKHKVSEVESEDSEEKPLAKKFKSRSVLEECEEEWEEWDGVQDKEDWPKDSGEEREAEEVREEIEEVREVVKEVREEVEEVREEVEEVREEVEEVQEVVKEVREEVEEVRATSVNETEAPEKTEEEREKDKREAKRVRKEMRRSERLEEMKDLIHVVVDLGKKVDRYADEVRVSNALRNRADREYLEERRRWYFSDRMLHAKDWEKDLDVDSEGHSV